MSRKLTQRATFSDGITDVLVCRYSPDGSYLATGSADGHIRIYHPRTTALLFTLPPLGDAVPITALRWRGGGSSKTKNVLIASSADGSIKHWHVPSQKVLSKTQTPDQVYCIDSRVDAEQYASAGKDKVVRLHDDTTGAVVLSCRPGGYDTIGHSNRIFCVKYHPNDATRVVSGGWDNSVILWDTRTGASSASIFGPHICGDAIDLHDNMVLTGSWRPERQLQLWDVRFLRRNEPVIDIPWSAVPAGSGSSAALATRVASRSAPALLYAAQFSSGGHYIAAGGSGSNEAKVFDAMGSLVLAAAIPDSAADLGGEHPTAPPPVLCGTIAGLSRSVYSVCFDNDNHVAVSGGNFLMTFEVMASAGSAAASAAASGGAGGALGSHHTVKESDGSSTSRSNGKLSKAEEAMLEAAYGGVERDDDEDDEVVAEAADKDAINPAARFGMLVAK